VVLVLVQVQTEAQASGRVARVGHCAT